MNKPQSRWLPAWANRWTSQAHENRREIARRTTRPGTPERAEAYALSSLSARRAKALASAPVVSVPSTKKKKVRK